MKISAIKAARIAGGNFKSDPERASETGKKGGEHSHGGGRNSKVG
ncbi:con-10 family general stress protein [Halomonas sp. WWR20]